jgi:hypothetical protein
MNRIKFKKYAQKRFILKVLKNSNCPSLRALNQFGFGIPYSTLKNYFNESRTIPEKFFDDLCHISKIKKESLKFKTLPENWGKIKGGKN